MNIIDKLKYTIMFILVALLYILYIMYNMINLYNEIDIIYKNIQFKVRLIDFNLQIEF